MGETEDFKCPCCGGSLTFNASEQNVKCPFCDSEFSLEDVKKFNTEKEAEESFEEKTEWGDAGQEWTESDESELKTYLCESCGGELITDENTAATACPYCGNAVVIKGRVSGTVKPDLVIPFKKTKENAKDALKNYITSKKLVDRSFIEGNTLEEIKGVYVPYWLFTSDVDAHITYRAETRDKYKQGDDEYEVTRYYSVTRAGTIGYDNVPVDGSKKMPNDITESIEPYVNSESVEFETPYLTGYLADKYDIPQEEARPRATERIRKATEDAFENTVRGYDSVSVDTSKISLFNNSSKYALYPVWMLRAKHEDEYYTFAMNGQTGKMVGNLPVDKKLATIWFAAISVIAAVVFSALGCAIFGGDMIGLAIGLGVVLGLAIGGIVIFFMIRNLKTVRYNDSAESYYRSNSMNITYSDDTFLYKKVRKL